MRDIRTESESSFDACAFIYTCNWETATAPLPAARLYRSIRWEGTGEEGEGEVEVEVERKSEKERETEGTVVEAAAAERVNWVSVVELENFVSVM